MMPWERQGDELDIPAFLKRDANNHAPYMDSCVDEGCPRYGTTHVCINLSTNRTNNEPRCTNFPWDALQSVPQSSSVRSDP